MLSRVSPIVVTLFVLGSACNQTDSVDTSPRKPDHQVRLQESQSGKVERVRRTLDFSDSSTPRKRLMSIPYGKRRRELGFAPICRGSGCAPPCPCSAQVQPSSHDVDRHGRVWIADQVKRRIAVFNGQGKFLPGITATELDSNLFDLQVVSDSVAVLRQQQGESQLIVISGSSVTTHDITFNGEEVDLSTEISSDDTSLFSVNFVQDEDLTEREVPVRLGLPESPKSDSEAEKVPGRPFRDGWLHFQGFAGARVVPLKVASSDYEWSKEIRFTLKQRVGKKTVRKRGNVSWELEIGPDGSIHLLLFAGTYGKSRVDGYWYLRVAPDGAVGTPTKLAGPRTDDDQQTRRLTLDQHGDPLLMWAGRRGVLIEALPRTD